MRDGLDHAVKLTIIGSSLILEVVLPGVVGVLREQHSNWFSTIKTLNGGNVIAALEGFRVLDLTDNQGYLCGRILGHLGADVIKVEKPGGDVGRDLAPLWGDQPGSNKSLYWLALNANKRGITLDIEKPQGASLFKELVKKADFVIESYPVGYLKSIGLDYKELSTINPKLVFVSITPFGQTGPYSNLKASELTALATAGYLFTTGDSDRPPANINIPLAYLFTGADAVVAALVAHYYRNRTEKGQFVDVSIQHCTSWLAIRARLWHELSGRIIHRSGPLYQYTPGIGRRFVWKCKDGSVIFTLVGGATGQRQNRLLSQWMIEEGISSDILGEIDWDKADIPEVAERLEDALNQLFGRHTKAELVVECQKRGIILGPVNNIEEVIASRQLASRDFWEKVDHPESGGTLTYPGAFFKSSLFSCVPVKRAPLVGEHNREVFEELGVSQEALADFQKEGVV